MCSLLIANINVFQLWTLQLESHLWKPSRASLLYSSCDQRTADLPLVYGQSWGSQCPAQHHSIWFDRTGQLINSNQIPNTLQQTLLPFPRTSSATLSSMANPPRLSAPAGWAWSAWLYAPVKGTLCDKASQWSQKRHLPCFNDSKPHLTWGSLCGWQRHSISLVY